MRDGAERLEQLGTIEPLHRDVGEWAKATHYARQIRQRSASLMKQRQPDRLTSPPLCSSAFSSRLRSDRPEPDMGGAEVQLLRLECGGPEIGAVVHRT